VLNWDSEVKHL